MTEILQPPAPPPPPLRWYQYRLRSLLILTTLTAVFFSAATTLGYVEAAVCLVVLGVLVALFLRVGWIFRIVLLILLLVYVGSYVVLSSGGCYEPAAIGLNGVKGYGWAPRGFVDHYRWKRWPAIVYLPLYIIDVRAWHRDAKVNSGRYPVDEVKPKDIWKVYKALGF